MEEGKEVGMLVAKERSRGIFLLAGQSRKRGQD